MFRVILRWCFLPDTLGQTAGLCTLSLLKLSLVESELFTRCCPTLPISITPSHPQTMASGFQASSFVIITYQLPRLFQFVIGSISRWQPVISLRNMGNKRVNYPFTAVASQRRIHYFTWVSNLWDLHCYHVGLVALWPGSPGVPLGWASCFPSLDLYSCCWIPILFFYIYWLSLSDFSCLFFVLWNIFINSSRIPYNVLWLYSLLAYSYDGLEPISRNKLFPKLVLFTVLS